MASCKSQHRTEMGTFATEKALCPLGVDNKYSEQKYWHGIPGKMNCVTDTLNEHQGHRRIPVLTNRIYWVYHVRAGESSLTVLLPKSKGRSFDSG